MLVNNGKEQFKWSTPNKTKILLRSKPNNIFFGYIGAAQCTLFAILSSSSLRGKTCYAMGDSGVDHFDCQCWPESHCLCRFGYIRSCLKLSSTVQYIFDARSEMTDFQSRLLPLFFKLKLFHLSVISSANFNMNKCKWIHRIIRRTRRFL